MSKLNKFIIISIVFMFPLFVVSTLEMAKQSKNKNMGNVQGASQKRDYPKTANAYNYYIDKATAGYSVTKVFFNKPVEVVTGTTTDVNGYGWISKDLKTIYVYTEVDVNNLKTDSSARDKVVLGMFSDKKVKLLIDSISLPGQVAMNAPFDAKLPAKITINGITKDVSFDVVNALITEKEFKAKGTASVKISDFGLTAPSMASVYKVEDAFKMNFEVRGLVNN